MVDGCPTNDVAVAKENLLECFFSPDFQLGTTHLQIYLKTAIIDAVHYDTDKGLLAANVTRTLAELICAGANPDIELPRLKASLGASGPCGKILQYGEPTFSCVDCALDATCVMCMDCYNASIHHELGHNLMVHTSFGRGMCDCGDNEAWKHGATCSIHSGTCDSTTPLEEKLPQNVQKIVSALFEELLTISIKSFIEENDVLSIPDTLVTDPEKDSFNVDGRFVTVIYNDEIHNFDEVIDQFKDLVKCSHSEGSKYATSIDREGRMLIKKSTVSECTRLKDKFLGYKPSNVRGIISQRPSKEPLVTRAMPEYIFCLQNLLIEVINWMTEISQDNPAFRRILCKVSFKGEPISLIENIMMYDVNYWKKVKTSWHNLFMSSYFIDPLYKKDVGVLFIKNYNAIIAAFLDDHKFHDFTYSIISLTVQLFTVPSISIVLMTDYSAVEIIFQQFIDFYIQNVVKTGSSYKIHNLKSEYSGSVGTKRRQRIHHVLNDARYILANIPDVITQPAVDAFLKFFVLFVKFVSYMQEMNPHVRQTGNHIIHEKEWEQYFLLEIMEIKRLMPIVAQWCTSNKNIFQRSLNILLDAQLENNSAASLKSDYVTTYPSLESLVTSLGGATSTALWEKEHREMNHKAIFANKLCYISHDMFKDPVSFHIPVTRLLWLLMSYKVPTEKFGEFIGDDDMVLPRLLDIPLRSILLSQQIEANMWKRNGTTMDNQTSCYRDHYKSILWDQDLLAVQVMFSMMDPDEALLRIIRKYKIEPYFVLLDSEISDYDPLLRMAEAFAFLLLYTLAERYRLNISSVTEADILRKDIIHVLTIMDLPRSKIIKSIEQSFVTIEEDITKTEVIDGILDELSHKIPVEDGIKMTLRLKPEFYNEFTPFYYHFSPGQRQKAEQTYNERYLSLNKEFKPPTLPKFTKITANLRAYFVSPVFQRFIYVVFRRYTRENPVLVSDLLVHQALYLVMFALLDEKTSPDDPTPTKFSEVIHSTRNTAYLIHERNPQSIVSLIKIISNMSTTSIKEVRAMLKWILETAEFLKNGQTVSSQQEHMSTSYQAPQSKADDRKERLRKHRENVMKNFKFEQTKFLADNAGIFDNMDDDEMTELEEDADMPEVAQFVVCGPNKGPIPRPESVTLTCILCKDNEKVLEGHSTMMYGCLIEKSVVLKMEKNNDISNEYRLSYLLSSKDIHIQSCGHPMHLTCLQSIMSSPNNIVQHVQELQRLRFSRLYTKNGEFACPLCKMAANCAIPVVGYDCLSVADVSTEQFMEDVSRKLNDNEDIGEMEVDLSDSPSEEFSIASLGEYTQLHDTNNFLALIRDTMINEQPVNNLLSNSPSDDTNSESMEVDPSTKFKEDMRRFYRQAKNTLNRDEISSKCSAPYTLKLIAYTFSVLEFILKDKPLLSGLAEYQEDFLQSFLRSLYKSMTINDHLYIQELTRELLYLYTSNVSENVNIPSILNMDIFTVFVASRFGIYTEGKCYNGALVELCVIAEIFKILISTTSDETMGVDASANDSNAIQLATMWGFVRKLCGVSASDDPYPCPTSLVHKVKVKLLPLLRKLSLFLRYATSIPCRNALRELQSPEGEFSLLMEYLNIPSLSKLLDFDQIRKIKVITKWCKTFDKSKFESVVELAKTQRDGKLIDLPVNFVDLLMQASKYNCPIIKFGKIQTTALCLVCGQFVCFQSYCCQGNIGEYNVGPCNMHANECSGDLGVFLIFDKCQVLFLPVKSQGILVNGPYLDKYGENLKNNNRNKALTLSPVVYRKLELMWIKHEVRPMVARKSEGLRFNRNFEHMGIMY